MKQALIFIQTSLFFLLPLSGDAFNTKLGSEGTTEYATKALPLPFLEKVIQLRAGKVIKELINPNNPYQIKTVVIDAGHGGHDPGCSGSSSQEKHLALAIAKKLTYLLGEQYPEIKFIMTRDKDVFIPLYRRAAIANRNNADLFISIHCNYMPGSSATRGTETYVMGLHTAEHNLKVAKRENAAILLEEDYEKNYDYDPNSPEGHIMLSMYQSAHLEQSILFADLAELNMKEMAGRRSRGVKQAGFVVLKETTMPSVLVEAGFLSSTSEQNFLKTEGGQMKIAKALLKAFTKYKSTVESPEYLQFTQAFKEVASLPKAEPLETQAKPVLVKSQTKAPGKTERSAVPPPSTKPAEKTYSNIYQAPKTVNNPVDNSKQALLFYVQIAASGKLQDTKLAKWSNLNYPIEVVQEDGLYKYRARGFNDLSSVQNAKKILQGQGFPDAFVVVFQGDKKISMADAQNILNQ